MHGESNPPEVIVYLKNWKFAFLGLAAAASCGHRGASTDDLSTSEVDQLVIGDNDNDGVLDLSDLDDDNDGILDQVECPAETLQGKEFWMMFNRNGHFSTGRRDIFFAGAAGTTVTINADAPLTIPASGLLTATLADTMDLTANTVESNKAIHIVTSAGVTVFANNFEPYTVDAFTVLPLGLLGTDYYAVGYPNSLVYSGVTSQIGVVATEDGTVVTIGTDAARTLNKGQSFLRAVVGDVTGMHITSNKPIAVNSGDTCLNTGVGACDHVEEMLLPTDAWASEFFVPSIPQNTDYRVVASQAGTTVSVDGTVVATLGAGQFYSAAGSGAHITTSKPTEAYMIAKGDTSGTGDPAFLLLPGKQNAVGSATFAALAADNVNTLVVSIPTAAIATVKVDGLGVTPTWKAYGTGGFSQAQIVVTAGDHIVTADQAFIPVVWGEKSYESYAYVAGLQVMQTTCGTDTDSDGIVDSFDLDSDGDGVNDVDEAAGTDIAPRDGLADGPVGSNGVPSSAGGGLTPPDTDGDGIADTRDRDTDNDGVLDGLDSDRKIATQCRDVDGDSCDDCSNTGADNSGGSVSNDGVDTDGDGRCDGGDLDDDNDGVPDVTDADPSNPKSCRDVDSDSCDDCALTGANNSGGSVSDDGVDFDADGQCDAGDSDDDNDGAPDSDDSDDNNPHICSDSDADTCDDCSSGTLSTSNDGADFDADGQCDAGDSDDDNDGSIDANDTDDNNPMICSDVDADTCDDCTSRMFAPASDGADSDGDGICDAGDNDWDNDGVLNNVDNCPFNANGSQMNHDGDTQGDICDSDDDNDGASDLEEYAAGTNVLDADCDDDGVLDGAEGGLSIDSDGDGLINALDPDSDNDGLLDGTESGLIAVGGDTDVQAGHFVPDADGGATTTNPLNPDTDSGGVKDGAEDFNHNGRIDGNETDPNNGADDSSVVDTDHDGISDAEERVLHTNPNDADTDDDGILDGSEPNYSLDSDGDGLINAMDPDSDNDGLFDGTEVGIEVAPAATDISKGHFIADADIATHTNPLDPDTDHGGVKDGAEDTNRDGKFDNGELNPLDARDDRTALVDSDHDGLTDAQEAVLGTNPNDADSDDDGVLDGAEPNYGDDTDGDGKINALDADSDNDGLFDGTELGITVKPADTDASAGHFIPDADSSTHTSMLNADTDFGGVPDGIEDENHDGRIEQPEGDPNNAADDDPNRDRDGDGIKDLDEGIADADGDGIANFLDLDSDGDGISDHDEAGDSDLATAPVDSDGDQTPDFLDIDSDGDSISDKDEAGDADLATPPLDSDDDGTPDYLDLDSDDDYILDSDEAGDADLSTSPINSDGTDQPDYLDADTDNDGKLDIDEAGDTDVYTPPVNTDGTDLPDWRDIDSDNDGVPDSTDNCRLVVNTDQLDANNDGIGNLCQDDADGDGIQNADDNCPLVANTNQVNTDGSADGGNACDSDDDNDNVLDVDDNCPLVINSDQLNTDGAADGGNACDADDDNDGKDDGADNCPLISNTDQTDTDGDHMGDACDKSDDRDTDDDGIKDNRPDNCMSVKNTDQLDSDSDGIGDVCDVDVDGNGFNDTIGVAGGGCSTSGSHGSTLNLVGVAMVLGAFVRRRRRAQAATLASIGLGAIAATTTLAHAQVVEKQDFSVERFSVSQDRNGILSVESGELGKRWSWDMHLWLGSANDPLNVYNTTDGQRQRIGSLVQNRIGGELGGSMVLLPWLQAAADLPLIFDQSRATMQTGINGMLTDIGGVGLGDLRLSPKAQLLRSGKLPVNIALTLEMTIPTASAENYRGEKGVTAYPYLSVSNRKGRVRWAVNLGYLARSPKIIADLRIDDELRARLGVGYKVSKALDVGLNVSLATAANAPLSTFGRNYSEVLVGPSYTMDSKWVLFVAGGAGLQSGYGSPDWRALAGVRIGRFGSEGGGKLDPDGDGILGDNDACPAIAEDRDGFQDSDGCPDPDNDVDQVADVDDKCPTQAEDHDGFEDDDGCPEIDNDNDGIADAADKCPSQAETVNGFNDQDGCPDSGDSDGDGIADDKDTCPTQTEDLDGFEDLDGCIDDNDHDGVADTADRCAWEAGVAANGGCPDHDRDGDTIVDRLDTCPDQTGVAVFSGCATKQSTTITSSGIDIVDVVYFKTDRDVILPRSFKLLDNVAAVIKSHTDLPAIVIEGHTDDRGGEAHNMDLSQRRAASVKIYLISKGVDASRLEAKGFGPTKPIASNATNSGRSANRRVEFKIAGVESLRTGPTESMDSIK
jgi:large repetitive protein